MLEAAFGVLDDPRFAASSPPAAAPKLPWSASSPPATTINGRVDRLVVTPAEILVDRLQD
jgi:hypothetical protein